MNCGWLRTLNALAENSTLNRSVMEMRFTAVTSKLLIGRVNNVLRPTSGRAPALARTYWAVELFALYATTNGLESKFPGPGGPTVESKSFSPQVANAGSALVQRGLDPVPVPVIPAGLSMT